MSDHSDIDKDLEDLPFYSIKLVSNSKSNKLIAKWLMFLFILLILSFFLPWQQNIEGLGIVSAFKPEERPQMIQALIAGKIEKWYVAEGQKVKKGDTIAVISEIKEKFFDPEIISRLGLQLKSKELAINAKKSKIQALQNQFIALNNGLGFSLKKAKNKLISARQYVSVDSLELIASKADFDIAKVQLDRQQKLYDQGLVSLTNFEQRKLKFQQANAKYLSAVNKLNSERNTLLNAEIELNSLKAEYDDKIYKSLSEKDYTESEMYESMAGLEKLKTEYTNLQMRNNLYVIRAPQSGYVIKAMKQGIGETLKEGEQIATILPNEHHLSAELYFKSVDLPLLKKGVRLRLQFDGWPSIVFSGWPGASVGTFGGIVQVVDYVSSSNGKFRVLVTPDFSQDPWPEQLRLGSGVVGWAMLNNVVLGYELWRQFNGFPPDFINSTIPKEKIEDIKKSKDYDSKDESEQK